MQRSLAGLTEAIPTPGGYEYLSTIGHVPAGSVDRYTLTTLHAKGGIGQVWLARDAELDREVALKELRPELLGDDVSRRRFLLEAKITGQLDHPGVVPVYELAQVDAGHANARPYYTMRFIRGRTLSEAVASYHRDRASKRAGRGEWLELLQAFLGVCHTVAFAHSKGVIHRDLKGQNIVLGAFGEVILLDWGLAKLVDRSAGAGGKDSDVDLHDPTATTPWGEEARSDVEGLTAAGQVLGTPAYMAPEQAEGRLDRIGRATDIYGLGAILYAILTGKAPFEGSTSREVLRKVREESPTPPRRINLDAPRALEAVCLKAMAKVPEARYESAAALADDVKRWLVDEPVSAWSEPWTTRARRWVGRHRTGVIAGVTALVVAVAGLAALAFQQERANRALQHALERESIALGDASDYSAQASRAIGAFYAGITEDVILRRPELKELRDRLLRTARDFYETQVAFLTDPRRAQDYNAANGIVTGLDRIASLLALLGDRDEAIRTRQRIIETIQTHPAFAPIRDSQLARALNALGNLQRLAGHPSDAMRSLRESLALYEELRPEVVYRQEVALVKADLGRLLFDMGKSEEGRRLLEEARALQLQIFDPRSIAKIPRDRAWITGQLAATVMTLGNLHEAEGRLDEAIRDYEEDVSLYDRLQTILPSDLFYRAEVARSLNNLGLARARSGQIEAGLAVVERGRAIREALLADQPLNIEYRGDLARSHYHLARVKNLAAEPAEALRAINEAESLYEGIPPKGPEDIYFKACLKSMKSGLIGAGKSAEALSDAERAASRESADEAIRLLKDAAAAGYGSRSRFEHDPPLDPIRSRPDFQELVQSLDTPNA